MRKESSSSRAQQAQQELGAVQNMLRAAVSRHCCFLRGPSVQMLGIGKELTAFCHTAGQQSCLCGLVHLLVTHVPTTRSIFIICAE